MNMNRRRFLGAAMSVTVLTRPARGGIEVTHPGKPPRWFASGGDAMRDCGWKLIGARVVLRRVDQFLVPMPPAGVHVVINDCCFEIT